MGIVHAGKAIQAATAGKIDRAMNYPKIVIPAEAGISTRIDGGWQKDLGLRRDEC